MLQNRQFVDEKDIPITKYQLGGRTHEKVSEGAEGK
jgi:hypothetical protein